MTKLTFFFILLFNIFGVHGDSKISSQISGSKSDFQQGYYPSQVLFYHSQFFAVMSINEIGTFGATPQVRRYLPNNISSGGLDATLAIPLPCTASECTATVLFISLSQNLLSGFAISGSGSAFSGSLFFSIDLDSFSIAALRFPSPAESEMFGMWGYFPGSGLRSFASITDSSKVGALLASLDLAANFSTTSFAKINPFTNIMFGATSSINGNILISGDSVVGGAAMILNSSLQSITPPLPLRGFHLPTDIWPPAVSLQNSDLALLSWFLQNQTALSLISLSSPSHQLSPQDINSDGLRLLFGDTKNIILVLQDDDTGNIILENYQIVSINPTKLTLLGSSALPQPLLLNPISYSLAQSHSEQYDSLNQKYSIITGSFSDWVIYIMQLLE